MDLVTNTVLNFLFIACKANQTMSEEKGGTHCVISGKEKRSENDWNKKSSVQAGLRLSLR